MNKQSIHPLIQKFFLQWLMAQRNVSPQTVKSYRDAFRIYLRYVNSRHQIPLNKITISNFDAEHILGFLTYLDEDRGNAPETINNRLAALHCFAKFLIFELPDYSDLLNRSLSVPYRKTQRRQVDVLTESEYAALKNACKTQTVLGCRDMLMLILLYNTGMRVSELVALKPGDIHANGQRDAYIHITGKGRKERSVPLWPKTAEYLLDYMYNNPVTDGCTIFRNNMNGCLTRSGVRYRLDSLQKQAAPNCPSLSKKKITPHTFRHTTALRMLQAGVDIAFIAIWLGHESITTTHKYLEADLQMKRKSLEKMGKPGHSHYDYQPDETVLTFLDSL